MFGRASGRDCADQDKGGSFCAPVLVGMGGGGSGEPVMTKVECACQEGGVAQHG